MEIHLGYCCVSMLHKKLQCSRASTKTYLEKHSKETCHDYLIEKAKQNLADLKRLLVLNYENNILCYRVPEQVLPQVDLGYYEVDELQTELKEVGEIANKLNLQLSTHPSQYFVLNSLREDVVERTVHSLSLIAEVFENMQLNKIPNLTLHLGMKQGYDSIEKAIATFSKNYERLGEAAKKYLVLENDHVSFTVKDCLSVHHQIGIPIVFDNKHYEWNSGLLTYEDALSAAVHTWGARTPKLHLSSDKEGKKHAHSDFIEPEDYFKMRDALLCSGISECYIMLECKQKDSAVIELRKSIS